MLHFTDKLEPRKILLLLSEAVPYYLKSWQDIDESRGLFGAVDPRTFNMRAVESSSPVIEYVIRPHLHVLCVLAAYIHRNDFDALDGRLDREVAVDKLVRGIRWACDTHVTGCLDVDSFLERKRWGRNWRSGLWTGMLSLSAFLVREHLPSELMQRVREVLAFEADRFIDLLPPSGCEIDTILEENAHDTLVLAWAVNMIPDHPHKADWDHSLRVWALNIATCIHDKADHGEYLGSSVSRHITTQTVYPDMTAENHGFFHPLILSYGAWVVLAMASYSIHGREPPPFLAKKHHQKTFDVLLRFCLPSGMIFEPGGHDLPLFTPRPFALAWGLWNNDPRAVLMTNRLLAWIDGLISAQQNHTGQWILGLPVAAEGWELFFQSQVGFELAMLAVIPFQKEFRFYSSGQIESAVDTRCIYPFVQVCYRRNTRTTRSVAWKALGGHPIIGLSNHAYPELIATSKASLLGIPMLNGLVKSWEVAFHHDRLQRDGFDTFGRIYYNDASGERLLRRDVRVLTWGDDGLVVLDKIVAERDMHFEEQYLSPVYLVNDHWTKNRLTFNSGSLREISVSHEKRQRELSCPSFWASVEDHLLFQFVWGRTKGLVYLLGGERNAPGYWRNCRLDMLAVRVEGQEAVRGATVYKVGYYVGAGKGPRPFKATGSAGEFFKGLVIMDGKNTVGFD